MIKRINEGSGQVAEKTENETSLKIYIILKE